MTDPIDQFYDRSLSFGQVVGAAGGSQLRIALTAGAEFAATPGGQVLLAALCDILPRIGRRYTAIDLLLPDVPMALPRLGAPERTLPDYLLARLRAVCPWGTFRIGTPGAPTYDHAIAVGSAPIIAAHQVFGWSSGWRCFVLTDPKEHLPEPGTALNSMASLATAALSAMAVYTKAEKIAEPNLTTEIPGWSLFDLAVSSVEGPDLPKVLEVGKVIQAGLGGTGNALLWALRFGPELTGQWRAFEHEALELSNGNRYLFMLPNDRGPKGTLVNREFAGCHPALDFKIVQERLEAACNGLAARSMALATVDDPATRIFLQRQKPQTVLNVGTDSQWMSLSRHDLSEIERGAPCIECLYGGAEQPQRRRRESTVSFVTALVGALLGAEVVKQVAFPHAALRHCWGANIFYPSLAFPLKQLRAQDCRTCSLLAPRKESQLHEAS
jgi:hypothetical protein